MFRKMSFRLVLIALIALLLSISGKEDEVNEKFNAKRICRERKDYVDASVIFRNTFYVIMDRLYYEFVWEYPPFNYRAEGIQEIVLKEYDRTWKVSHPTDEVLKKGRFLGGFFHHTIHVPKGQDESLPISHIDEMWNFTYHTLDNITEFHNIEDYWGLTDSLQFVIFKDEHELKDMYHAKFQDKNGNLVELPDDLKLIFGDVISRGNIENLLPLKDELPKELTTLPIALSFESLTVYVIKNQKNSKDVPRLYYKNLMLKSEDWHYVDIPQGYVYKAFIPRKIFGWGVDPKNAILLRYWVIAEPFRDTKIDKNRGPSFLFNLTFDEKRVPSLVKWDGMSGMSIFGCEFRPPSSVILYYVFGSIVGLLVLILVIILVFVSFNFLSGKDRMIIVRSKGPGTVKHKTTDSKKRISLKLKENDPSEADKRSEVE